MSEIAGWLRDDPRIVAAIVLVALIVWVARFMRQQRRINQELMWRDEWVNEQRRRDRRR